MADSAADMIGVNTHLNYHGTVYVDRFAELIRPRLVELGVRHIRDNPGDHHDTPTKQRFVDLAQQGVRVLLANWNHGHIAYVKSLNAMGVGTPVVEAVEPPNEHDIAGREDWQESICDFSRIMHEAYKADPATAGLTVLGPSFANTRDAPGEVAEVCDDASASMDAGNLHNYSGLHPEQALAGGWGISLPEALQRYRALAGDRPLWVSENGYRMSRPARGFPAVTERAAAKYLPRQFLMHLKQGVPRYYIYQLINNDDEDFGLLNDDGSRRLQYVAVKNFIALFGDPGPAFGPGTLDYSLSGDLADIQRALFQKRDGRFYLVIWQGVASVEEAPDGSLRDIEPAPRQLTLQLSSPIREARVLRPSFSLEPVATHRDANGIAAIPLSVSDQITVVELIPRSEVQACRPEGA
ncbi:hypothetical protein SH611_15370 [Geminicoccaceae bacterium 1502E]|nr:hypothetical protein [Geminicoccaceae bacterium 1502E]